MSEQDRHRWDRKWQERRGTTAVNPLLRSHRRWWTGGLALDVACGQGQNAIWLAHHGYHVLGVDISRVALAVAQTKARQQGVEQLVFAQVDLDQWRPTVLTYDLICVFRFLDRTLFPALEAALRPGGFLVYQTRHSGRLLSEPDANPEYLLQPGELRRAFSTLTLYWYEAGRENASLIARKPKE